MRLVQVIRCVQPVQLVQQPLQQDILRQPAVLVQIIMIMIIVGQHQVGLQMR